MNDSRAASAAASDGELAERIALGSAELGMGVTPQQVETLVRYLRLLERWNATYNLTAIRDPRAMVVQHILDCLAAAAALLRHDAHGKLATVLDVGSGAGLPGLVLATVVPRLTVTCVDAVGKKAAFVRQAAGALGLNNVTARHTRVETLQDERFDLIASRAFASLVDFVRITRRLLAPGGEWMAMKGKVADGDMLPLTDLTFHVEPLHVPGLGAERNLIWVQPSF